MERLNDEERPETTFELALFSEVGFEHREFFSSFVSFNIALFPSLSCRSTSSALFTATQQVAWRMNLIGQSLSRRRLEFDSSLLTTHLHI